MALALAPVFGECEVATALAGARLERVPLTHAGAGAGFFCDEPALRAALVELRPRLCWLCSPNNPTGAALPAALIAALVADHPDTLFVLDEAYCDLLPEPQWERESLAAGNLIVLHSMTKYWGLAGLRLGHAVAAPRSAAALRAAAPPWSVNACAQAAGVAALADLEHHERAVALLVAERDRLVAGLRELGWTTEPTTAGFFLIHAGDAAAAAPRAARARLPGARLHLVRPARAHPRQPAAPGAERPAAGGVRRAGAAGGGAMNAAQTGRDAATASVGVAGARDFGAAGHAVTVPRLVIGAPRSGEGKTTVALGLMAALRRRGLGVQGYKVGPDYLDTGYQRYAAGVPGRNLDLFMMGEPAVVDALAGTTADVAVVEGVMGLFDGHRDGVTPTSTADVAQRLRAPVVLVVDASRMAASAGAIALGFATFDPDVRVAGVHPEPLEPAPLQGRGGGRARAGRRAGARLPARGRRPGAALASPRARGRRRAQRRGGGRSWTRLGGARRGARRRGPAARDRARGAGRWQPPAPRPPAVAPAGAGARAAAGSSPSAARASPSPGTTPSPSTTPTTSTLLRAHGAELVFFSPLEAAELPVCDGLYLGGGYPELHAAGLSANVPLRRALAAALAGGLPTYAECGGLLYLCESLADLDGRTWPLVGAVPGRAAMHERLQGMGYREGAPVRRLAARPGRRRRPRPRVPLLELRARERAPRGLRGRRVAGGLRRRRPLRLATSTCTSPGTRPCSSTGSSAAGRSPARHRPDRPAPSGGQPS